MTTRLLALAFVVRMMLPSGAFAQKVNANPSVTPIHGANYGEWTAKWWQWLLAAPTLVNPNLDPTGANCAQGQSGPVWFLSGRFPGTDGPPFNLTPFVTRSCNVPRGKSLLLPLPNTVFGAGTGDCETPVIAPGPCREFRFGNLKDVPGLHAAAAASIDAVDVSNLVVTLDTVPIHDLIAYRAASPVFTYTLPQGNVFQAVFGIPDPAGKYVPAVSDGYWLLFEPLSPGVHQIIITNTAHTFELKFVIIVEP